MLESFPGRFSRFLSFQLWIEREKENNLFPLTWGGGAAEQKQVICVVYVADTFPHGSSNYCWKLSCVLSRVSEGESCADGNNSQPVSA